MVNDDIVCCNETLMIHSKPNIALKLGGIISFRRINICYDPQRTFGCESLEILYMAVVHRRFSFHCRHRIHHPTSRTHSLSWKVSFIVKWEGITHLHFA